MLDLAPHRIAISQQSIGTQPLQNNPEVILQPLPFPFPLAPIPHIQQQFHHQQQTQHHLHHQIDRVQPFGPSLQDHTDENIVDHRPRTREEKPKRAGSMPVVVIDTRIDIGRTSHQQKRSHHPQNHRYLWVVSTKMEHPLQCHRFEVEVVRQPPQSEEDRAGYRRHPEEDVLRIVPRTAADPGDPLLVALHLRNVVDQQNGDRHYDREGIHEDGGRETAWEHEQNIGDRCGLGLIDRFIWFRMKEEGGERGFLYLFGRFYGWLTIVSHIFIRLNKVDQEQGGLLTEINEAEIDWFLIEEEHMQNRLS